MIKKGYFAIPLVGAFSLAFGTILERFLLRRNDISVKNYQGNIFLVISLLMLPFLVLLWQPIPAEVFTLTNVFIFILIIALSIGANCAVFYSMKWEKLGKLEPAKILEPLFVILLAILFSYFFGQELYQRNLKIIIPAIIASLALVLSHIKKSHLRFNKYFLIAILGSFLFASELILSRLILEYFNPLSFYFFRAISIFLVSFLMFRPRILDYDGKTNGTLFLTGFFWVIYRLSLYYGYVQLGVVSTTLLVLLGPMLTYFFAYKFLKERLSFRNIIAAAVILASVLYGILA